MYSLYLDNKYKQKVRFCLIPLPFSDARLTPCVAATAETLAFRQIARLRRLWPISAALLPYPLIRFQNPGAFYEPPFSGLPTCHAVPGGTPAVLPTPRRLSAARVTTRFFRRYSYLRVLFVVVYFRFCFRFYSVYFFWFLRFF